MNKKEFLEKLEQRLKMLRHDEVVDILEEYGGYIDAKIAEGKTEQQAVADFGSIEELSREILAAYKLSDEYIPKNSKLNLDAVTDFLNQTIGYASDFFRNIFAQERPNQALSIFLSIMVALLVITVLKLPFLLVEEIGKNLIAFILPNFLEQVVCAIWIAAVNICYLVAAVLIVLALFKSGFGRDINDLNQDSSTGDRAQKAPDENTAARSQGKTQGAPDENRGFTRPVFAQGKEREDTKRRDVKKNENGTAEHGLEGVTNVLLALARLFMFLLLLPAYLLIIALGISFGALAYLLTQGISLFGLTLVLFSLLLMSSVVVGAVTRLIFSEKHRAEPITGTVIFAAILLGFGGVLCAFEFVSYDYIDRAPPTEYRQEIKQYEYATDEGKIILHADGSQMNVESSDTLEDKLKVEVAYDQEHVSADADRSLTEGGHTQEVTIRYEADMNTHAFFNIKTIYDSVIGGLKEKRIYNYGRLFAPSVTVYVSPEDRKYVTVNGDTLIYERQNIQ